MNDQALVLVTGSAGRVGRATVSGLLGAGKRVRGFDRVNSPHCPECIVGTLTDVDAVNRAMAGVHTLIHLAATPDDDDFMTSLLPNNIIGLYNVMEAARLAGVKRMVLASSGQVTWWRTQRHQTPIRPTDEIAPKHWYAITKVMMEAAGRVYANDYGMSVITVRLGWCPRTMAQVEEMRSLDWAPDVYFSPNDVGSFFVRCVDAQFTPNYIIVYASSRPVRGVMFDLEPTKRLLNWEPQEQWPTGADEGTAG